MSEFDRALLGIVTGHLDRVKKNITKGFTAPEPFVLRDIKAAQAHGTPLVLTGDGGKYTFGVVEVFDLDDKVHACHMLTWEGVLLPEEFRAVTLTHTKENTILVQPGWL